MVTAALITLAVFSLFLFFRVQYLQRTLNQTFLVYEQEYKSAQCQIAAIKKVVDRIEQEEPKRPGHP